MEAYLVLENGAVFEGESFGAVGETAGEVVFTTGMTGYLETLTDPSYFGQIVVQTFPLIGNYGIIPEDFESAGPAMKAYIVKHPCKMPSNFRSEGTLDAFLKDKGIIGLCGIDTRALTKIIRRKGVMNGKITVSKHTHADVLDAKAYGIKNPVAAVSSVNAGAVPVFYSQTQKSSLRPPRLGGRRVALLDLGAKRGIAEALVYRGCEVHYFPHNAKSEEILSIAPSGIVLSNGPGDPADPANEGIIETIRTLMQGDVPLFGICLGHQLMALAKGHLTMKLEFGHRGLNQPVKELSTGRLYITSQNHGYAVVAKNSTFVNINDGTCEGLDYGRSFSVQFHPEARSGPLDTSFLFDRFIERIDGNAIG